MDNNKETKKRFFLFRWFGRLFGNRNKEMSIFEEELLQSPFRTILQNFYEKKLAMTGLIIFLLIFLLVFIGPGYWKLDLSYSDSTQVNIPPGYNMMDIPEELADKIVTISPGITYGCGVDQEGNVYIWGYTKCTGGIDLANIPQEVLDARIVDVSAGSDHIVALDDAGKIYVWGNTRLQQDQFSTDMLMAARTGKNWDIVQIEASNQFSAAVSSEGTLYLWGNANMADIKVRKAYQGNIEKVALTSFEYVVLMKDGTVGYAGYNNANSVFAAIPAVLEGKKVVDIAATSQTVAAVTEDGQIVVWGNTTNGERMIPEMDSRPKEIYGGRNHYTILCEDGSVYSWGNNTHRQTEVPGSLDNKEVLTVFAGYFQNYAITADGEIITWGLKGYLAGTDDLGRDVFNRMINGGKLTMTVGASSVIISTFLGILFGGLAGYFGGRMDLLIMRLAEVIAGLPFIPFAMILSAVIGSRLDPTQRVYLIMVVLGLLSWPSICRLVRAQILAEREKEFVTAAKAMGVREMKIVFKHIMPNIISILIVTMTLDFATCMLTEATLSYLGFGIPLPTPTWGNMLTGANNSVVIQQYWWRWVFPATLFGICTICINVIGDGLRDAVDPKSNGR